MCLMLTIRTLIQACIIEFSLPPGGGGGNQGSGDGEGNQRGIKEKIRKFRENKTLDSTKPLNPISKTQFNTI